MWNIGAHRSGLRKVPLTRQNLDAFIATGQKKAALVSKVQAGFLLGFAALIFFISALYLCVEFYGAPVSVAKRSWVHVRNLTPIVPVKAQIAGVLEHVFVTGGQQVQKGELLGAVQISSMQLDYVDAERDFADKIVQLHCLGSLLTKKSVFKLPYDAQLMVDRMARHTELSTMVEQCERELLRNVIADQSIEESIAALEDQFRLLENVVKIRGLLKQEPIVDMTMETGSVDNAGFLSVNDQDGLGKTYRDEYFPMMRLAEVEQELRTARKEYFLRRLQKEEELDAAIEQTLQEMRYLDNRLRELKQVLKKNFIYASITGTVVGSKVPKSGYLVDPNETVFRLQPLENEFQVTIALDAEDSNRFKAGTPTTVSLEGRQQKQEMLDATTSALLRKPNGELEAVLDMKGGIKKNAKIILAAGYRGEGEQRLAAYVTSGTGLIWQSLQQILLNKTPAVSH